MVCVNVHLTLYFGNYETRLKLDFTYYVLLCKTTELKKEGALFITGIYNVLSSFQMCIVSIKLMTTRGLSVIFATIFNGEVGPRIIHIFITSAVTLIAMHSGGSP